MHLSWKLSDTCYACRRSKDFENVLIFLGEICIFDLWLSHTLFNNFHICFLPKSINGGLPVAISTKVHPVMRGNDEGPNYNSLSVFCVTK